MKFLVGIPVFYLYSNYRKLYYETDKKDLSERNIVSLPEETYIPQSV
jgi:hypothetical protein